MPPGGPRTKPKAANYALAFARGEYLVVYDAEDRPEIDQLKKAVTTFRGASRRTACLQARLNFYNAHHNWLTRLLTYLAMLGPRRRGWDELTPYGLTVIAYWALVSVAGYRGLIQLITRPFFWEKTVHGVSPQI